MAEHRIYEDPEIGVVVLCKSRKASRISIRVNADGGVKVTVPFLVPYKAAEAFFRLKKEWVIGALDRQRKRVADKPSVAAGDIERMRDDARHTLPVRLSELAQRYGFIYNRVAIKHNKTNWGSCSAKSNINLNLNIVRLPDVLRDYILLHELCHLRHHDHGHAFHLLLEHVCTDNLLRLMDAGDELAEELARKAARSKAKYPVHHIMTAEIRKWRLV